MAKTVNKQDYTEVSDVPAQQSIAPVYEVPQAELLDFYDAIAEMLANDYLESKQD